MNTKISKKTADILGRAVPHIFGASAFFMGRVILFDTIDPVLMGYIGALAFEKSFYTACVFAVLGLATVGTRIYRAVYYRHLPDGTFYIHIRHQGHETHPA